MYGGIYEKIYRYLGIMLIPTLLFFILYGFVFLIKDKKLRFFWELRLYYTFIFFIIAVYLYILYSSGVFFINIKSFEVNGEFLRTLINKSLFEYNIGYLPTYILYELINISLKFSQYPFYCFYYFLIGFELFLIILMIFTPMRKSIKKSNAKRREERREKKRILPALLALYQAILMLPAMAPIRFLRDSALITVCIQIFKLPHRLIKTASGLLSFALRVQQISLI